MTMPRLIPIQRFYNVLNLYLFFINFYLMQDMEMCTNCKKSMPAAKVDTHFGYCRRNIIKCQLCGEMYDKNFIEDHEEEFHSKEKCQFCESSFKKKQIQKHQSTCTMKPKYCEYCEMNVPAKQFSQHYKQCESRTVSCQKCEKLITNKQFIIHQVICKGKVVEKMPDKSFNYQFQDSLTNFYQQENQSNRNRNKIHEKDQQKSTKINKVQKDKKQQINMKKQVRGNKKEQSRGKEEKKEIKQVKELKKQQFLNNYFNPEYAYQDQYQNIYRNNSYYDYQPHEPSYNHQENAYMPKSYDDLYQKDGSNGDIDIEDQLMQMTLLESRQNRKNSSVNSNSYDLPSDFYSQEIMNKSFYTDILDIQKQKAIMEGLSKGKEVRGKKNVMKK